MNPLLRGAEDQTNCRSLSATASQTSQLSQYLFVPCACRSLCLIDLHHSEQTARRQVQRCMGFEHGEDAYLHTRRQHGLVADSAMQGTVNDGRLPIRTEVRALCQGFNGSSCRRSGCPSWKKLTVPGVEGKHGVSQTASRMRDGDGAVAHGVQLI